MKKAICLAALCLVLMILLCACAEIQTGNRVVAGKDVQTFTYAYIRLGEKDIVEGYITQWRDYEDSDTVQIMINGVYYLTHYSCVVMIADPAHGNLNYRAPTLQDGGV